MFLVKNILIKNSTPLRPKLLINDAAPAVLRHTHSESEHKKCFKYRPSKTKSEACRPVQKPVPKFYRQLEPCRTDRQLALQHPKDLGKYARCDIPFKPECLDPCLMAVRLDDTMYRPSASLDRKFDRYWVECSIGKKKRCCRKVPPERSYRVLGKCDKIEKKAPCKTLYPMPCKLEKTDNRCPKIQVCGCGPLHNTQVNCRLAPRHKRCRRRPCLYPSFSECQHEELTVSRPIECRCLQVPSMCDMFRFRAMNRRMPCQKLDTGLDECK